MDVAKYTYIASTVRMIRSPTYGAKVVGNYVAISICYGSYIVSELGILKLGGISVSCISILSFKLHRAGYWRYSSKATVQKNTRLWNINGWIATE